MAGRGDRDLLGADDAATGLHRLHPSSTTAADGGDLAILDDVDAERVGGAGVAPGHRVVPGGARAALQGRPQHRVAHIVGDIEWGAECLRLFGRQPFVIDAVYPVGVDVALEDLHVMNVVRQHHHATLRKHKIVVERLRQALPELQSMVVKRGALVKQVVRTDDGGVATRIAAAEPAPLQHGYVADSVLLGEIVGGAEAMPARAHDHHVVFGLRFRRAPLWLPPLLALEAMPDQGENGETLHGDSSCWPESWVDREGRAEAADLLARR